MTKQRIITKRVQHRMVTFGEKTAKAIGDQALAGRHPCRDLDTEAQFLHNVIAALVAMSREQMVMEPKKREVLRVFAFEVMAWMFAQAESGQQRLVDRTTGFLRRRPT